jgi:hypothetical protein
MMLPSKTESLGYVLMRNGGVHHAYHQIVYISLQFSNICITRVNVPSLGPESK